MRIPVWVIDFGWLCCIPFLLLYAVTLGPLVGWLQSTFLIEPHWKWLGPIPIHKPFEKWDRVT